MFDLRNCEGHAISVVLPRAHLGKAHLNLWLDRMNRSYFVAIDIAAFIWKGDKRGVAAYFAQTNNNNNKKSI